MGTTGVGSGFSIGKEVRTVSGATWSTNVSTLTTSAAHGLAVGDRIRVVNVDPVGYNGKYTVVTVPTTTTLTVAETSDPGSFVSAGQLYSIGMTTTPTRVLGFLSESLDLDVAKIVTPTLSNGTLIQQASGVRQGRKLVTGDSQHLLNNKGEALVFEAMLGGVVTTGSGPYTHTFTPATDLPSYTIQTSFGAVTDTLVKQATGCMVDSWEIGLSINEMATLGLTWAGKDMTFATGDALDGTTPTGLSAYSYIDGTVTVGGASVGCVKSITISGANNLVTDDTCLGSSEISDQERGQFLDITGTVEFELEATSIGYLSDFVAGTQKTLVLTLSNSPSSITITLKMQWQSGITPKVEGTDKITVSGPFTAYVTSGDDDADTFTVAVVNADSTP